MLFGQGPVHLELGQGPVHLELGQGLVHLELGQGLVHLEQLCHTLGFGHLGRETIGILPAVIVSAMAFDLRLSTNQAFNLRLKVIRLSTFDFRLSTMLYSNSAFDLRL